MLKKEQMTVIAGLMKIPVDTLEKAIKDESEVDIEIPSGLTVLSTEELEARDNNTKNEAIKVGKELGVKEVRKAAGLEEGIGVDATKIASAIVDKAVADAKIEPNKKVNELQEQITQLKGVVTQKDTEISNIQKSAKQVKLDAVILKSLPKDRKSDMADEDYLTLVKSSLEFDDSEGDAIIVKKGGQPLRHATTKDPLPLGEALESHFKEKNWVGQGGAGGAGGQGGRGGGNNGGPKVYTKMSELKADWEASGKSIQGAEFTAKLTEVTKAYPEFDSAN
jgi:hypothetical protein